MNHPGQVRRPVYSTAWGIDVQQDRPDFRVDKSRGELLLDVVGRDSPGDFREQTHPLGDDPLHLDHRHAVYDLVGLRLVRQWLPEPGLDRG
jgi:hypothetical protein